MPQTTTIVIGLWFLKQFGLQFLAHLLVRIEKLCKFVGILPPLRDGFAEERRILWRPRQGSLDMEVAHHFISWPTAQLNLERLSNRSLSVYYTSTDTVYLAEYAEPLHVCMTVDRAPLQLVCAEEMVTKLVAVSANTFHDFLVKSCGEDLCTRVAFLAIAGRCGSTLAIKAMAGFCPNIVCFSEPIYTFAASHFILTQKNTTGSFLRDLLLFENQPITGKEGYFVKLSWTLTRLVLPFHDTFPEMKFLYMSRTDEAAMLQSHYRALNAGWMCHVMWAAEKLRLFSLMDQSILVSAKTKQLIQSNRHFLQPFGLIGGALYISAIQSCNFKDVSASLGRDAFPTILYEDFVERTEEHLNVIAQHCGFQGPYQPEQAQAKMSEDSQAGTILSKQALQVWPKFEFDPETRQQCKAFLRACGLSTTCVSQDQ